MAGNILGALLLEIVTKANTSGLDKTDRSLKRTGKTLRNIHKEAGFLSKMTGKLMGGFSIYGVKNMFDSYLQFEKDLGSMRSRFYAITLDENKANEEFEFIRKQAKDLALDIKSTADSYSIFYSATRKALGEEGTRGVFENWTKVGRVLHLSTYQMERVTYALREMASKGAIYSQDLRMQIGTHVPNAMGLAQKAAEELGFTGSDWFDKLQKSAKGNSKLTAEFVKRFSKQAELAYASPEALKKAMQLPDALAQQISNIGYNFMIDFSKAGGSYMIVKVLQGISKVLLSIDYDKLTTNLGNIARTLGDLAQYLPLFISVLKSFAIMFVGFKAISGLVKLGKLFTAFFYAFKQGKFIALLLSKLGFKDLAGTLVKAGVKTGGKLGLRALVGAGVNVIPVVGQILSILLTIWTAIDIVKGIIKFKFGDKPKDKIFGKYGTTAKDFYNTLNDITKNKGINTTEKLQQALAQTDAGRLLWANAQFNDNGDVIININGTNLTQDQIKDMAVETVKDIKDNKKTKYADKFQVPYDTRKRKLGR